MHPKISFLLVNNAKEIEARDTVNLLLEQLEPFTFQNRVTAFSLLFWEQTHLLLSPKLCQVLAWERGGSCAREQPSNYPVQT